MNKMPKQQQQEQQQQQQQEQQQEQQQQQQQQQLSEVPTDFKTIIFHFEYDFKNATQRKKIENIITHVFEFDETAKILNKRHLQKESKYKKIFKEEIQSNLKFYKKEKYPEVLIFETLEYFSLDLLMDLFNEFQLEKNTKDIGSWLGFESLQWNTKQKYYLIHIRNE
jgi:hypothetical protein